MIGDDGVDFRTVSKTIFAVDVLLSAKIHEEDYGDGGEDDGGTPGVICPASGHAHTCLRTDFTVCGIEETVCLSTFDSCIYELRRRRTG